MYIYMLCDHRAFMLPKSCSNVLSRAGKPRHMLQRQSRPIQPRSCFFPFSSFTSSWSPMENCWARICSAVVYATRRRINRSFSFHLVKLLMCVVDYFMSFIVCGCWIFFTHVLIYSGVYCVFSWWPHTPTLQGFCAGAHLFTLKCWLVCVRSSH